MNLKRPILPAVFVGFVAAAAFNSPAQLPAFPGAEGFGRLATGGRGGTVYHVTNLNDSGPGSFRDAVSQPNRTVVFDVGGIISYLPPRYNVAHHVTIAGQTAPGEGVELYGNGIGFSGANHSITRFIRFRMGINGDDTKDAVSVSGNSHDMMFDHVSVSWGRDETFSISSDAAPFPTNVTIQSCIIAQGLTDHSAGGLIQTPGGVSILRSYYVDNNIRNPKVKFVNEFVNNVVYNWGGQAYILGGDSSGDSYANVFDNYFINGPSTTSSAFTGGNLNFRLFATNNWQDANLNGALDGAVIPTGAYGTVAWQAAPFAYPITNSFPALTALKLAISDAGAWQHRDVVDERLLIELTSWGTEGQLISTEFDPPMNGPGAIKGGVAMPDFDQDGMPDFWELITGTPTNAPNNNDPSPSGYTKIEDYLNWLAVPHALVLPDQTVNVDLWRLSRGFTNRTPVYSLFNVTNGSAGQIANQFAQFTPSSNFTGLAAFSFSLADIDGSTFTQTVNFAFTPLAPTPLLTWRGDGGPNTWDVNGSYNWFDGQILNVLFQNGRSVLFDDHGSASAPVTLAGSAQPAAVTVDSTKNYTFAGSGSLDGAMTLIKTGSGTLAIATTNGYTGGTTVSNGTLLVHGRIDQSTVTVRSGATLGGRGRLEVAPVIPSGANLAPGSGVGGPGTFTVRNLTEAGGVTNRLDLSDDPTGTIKTNDRIDVVGNLTLGGVNTIQVNLLDGPPGDGVYTLFTYSSNLVGSLANLVVVGAHGTLTNPPGAIAFIVSSVRPPASLVWVGDGVNNVWDLGTNATWLNEGVPDRFYFLDDVRFDQTGSSNPIVNLSGALPPASLTVDAPNSFTFAGTGKITGTTGLLKTNSGTLTISTANDYTGPTILSGGVLSVAQLPNGGAAGSIGASPTNPANLVLDNATLRFTGASGSTDRGATFNAGGAAIDVVSGGTTLTWNGSLTGSGALTKLGAGRLDLNAASDYAGGTVVNAGTVRLAFFLNNANGFGSGPITLNGSSNSATFRFGSDAQTLNNQLTIVGTNNFVQIQGNDTIKDLDGSGTFQCDLAVSGTTFTLGGNMTGFSGTIRVGTIGNLRFNPSTGSANAIFDLGNTSVLLNNRNGIANVQIGALIGGPSTRLQGASSADSTTTYVIGGRNLDTTFAGNISQVSPARIAAITKIGTGTFTLSGSNAHLGVTIVSGGTLLVNNVAGSGTGSNSVSVLSGGTLGGTGFIRGPVTVNSGGALAPGAGVGTLTIRSNLTFNSGASMNFELGPTGASDKVAVSNALTLNGTLNLTNVAGFGAGTYTLFTYGGTLSGSLPAIGAKPSGFVSSLNTNTAGQVRLLVQAQTPPVFGSVVVGNGNVVMNGFGGLTNSVYYVLTSTNVALPRSNWSRIATNVFNGLGQFSFTNAINPAGTQQYYLLQLP